MMYDFHLHSEYSIDSTATMEDVILSAINKNIEIICFTDHIDLFFDSYKEDQDFDKSSYFSNIDKLKDKYNHKIEIMTGVELGLQPSLIDRYNKFMENSPFDFVIMSTHTVEDMGIHKNQYYECIDALQALERYYNSIYSSIKGFTDFDIVGHLDYIDRYIPSDYEIPAYDEYCFMVEKILKLIIENGKGIEINTSGLRYGLGTCHPKVEVLKLYRELGGDIITIGSDAHFPEDVGYGYESAKNLLKELGFKYIHIFKNRKSYPISIK